ncbi:MAG: Gfo/Idh/MocA family oxidoreductase [Bacteroidales bacterium]|jgi:predicted dehydrogenase|nr:Gfo/Idh/MocA family oxidoreductase [Bacteroidales bacterium]
MISVNSCNTGKKPSFTGAEGEIKLITLDPGHFHAALVQKNMYPQVSPEVFVYAPEGDDLNDHLEKIKGYNRRQDNPTSWKEEVYCGADFLTRMIAEKKGNVMITAGNNRKKTEYIRQAIDAGIHVLADKPMAINADNFELLRQTFAAAQQNGVLLYDIMTERFEIATMLQKEFSLLPEVFGALEDGTPEQPSVVKESVHHFAKYVSGAALKRPAWFFDVEQQGEGIVDVTTHLVDLVQWECFPEVTLDYAKDVSIISATRRPTVLSREQFVQVTGLSDFPDYLAKDVRNDSLFVYANGEINYRLKGKHVKVVVIWNYAAPEGAGDTHYSVMRGTKADLVIRQGAEQRYKPTLYIEPHANDAAFETALTGQLAKVQAKYPDVGLQKNDAGWEVLVPEKYHNGHEAHFGQVTERFLQYLIDGKLPEWEVPNMIAKYYTTTRALEMAK